MCEPPAIYGEWKIAHLGHWTIYIHPNQSYLGRCFAVLDRHVEDFFDITQEETDDYFSAVRKLRDAVRGIFQPDMLNYAVLGNDKKHVHLNFVPRYSSPREFAGIIFEDKRWGLNYSPYDKDFKIPKEALFSIRDAIMDELDKNKGIR